MKFRYKIAILSFLLFGMFITGAGETLLYAGTITLDTIVVTAPKEEGAEKGIESKTLKTHKVVDLAEILSDEMVEATMIRKGAYGNEVAIRGFGQSNLRVLIDDGLLEGACGSRKDPSLSPGGNNKVQGLIGYNYSESDQYEDGEGNKLYSFAPSGRPYNAEGRDMKAFEKQDVWGKLQLTPTKNQTILLSHTYGDAEDIMAPRVGMDMESEKTNLTSAEYMITELGNFSDHLTFSIYQNKVEHNPYDKYRTLVGNPPFHRHNDVDSTITGGKMENQQSTNLATLTYGIDMYKRNWKGDMYSDTGAILNDELIPDVDTYDYGVYVKGDKDFDKWSLGGGLRYDRFEAEANETLKQSSAVTATNKNTDDLPSGYLSAK